MIPTIAQVTIRVQQLLNDVAKEQFDDATVLPFIQARYRQLFSKMVANGIESAERFAFYNLPAYTNVLAPAQANITDMGDPTRLEERAITLSYLVTAASGTLPIRLTIGAHALITGQRVVVYGVGGETGANGEFYVTAPNGTQIDLNGSVSEGTYSSGGTVSNSGERFQDVNKTAQLPERDPFDMLRDWEWSGDKFRFIPATQDRQLKITYTASGGAPASGTLFIDDSTEFLAYGAACDLAIPNGLMTEAKAYDSKAATELDRLIRTMVREEQSEEWRSRPFTPPRQMWF
jgi:hypothetical protein